MALELFGLRIGIRVRDPLSLNSLLSRLPSGWAPVDSAVVDRLYSVVTPTCHRRNVRQFHVLYGDHGRLIRCERFDELLEAFDSDIDFYIASSSPNHLFVHAGAILWNGRAVVMPGRSRAGKTTLVTEFLTRGAAYYSDDFAMLDSSGHLHSYPRQLSVRSENGTRKRVRAAQLGASYAQSHRVSLILISEYVKDAPWSVEPISRGQGILRLLENTPSARKQPAFALAVLRRALEGAEVLYGQRGDSKDAVNRVARYLDRRPYS